MTRVTRQTRVLIKLRIIHLRLLGFYSTCVGKKVREQNAFTYSCIFFIFITTPEGHVGVHFGDIIISIQSGTENRLIILLVLALAQLALSTLDLLFFSGSGASTLARELEPPRPWLDVGAN